MGMRRRRRLLLGCVWIGIGDEGEGRKYQSRRDAYLIFMTMRGDA